MSYSDLHRDALSRAYVLNALDASIEEVNHGVLLLQRAPTNLHMQIHLTKSQDKARELLQEYSSIVTIWRAMVQHSMTMDWATATDMIEVIKNTVKVCWHGSS